MKEGIPQQKCCFFWVEKKSIFFQRLLNFHRKKTLFRNTHSTNFLLFRDPKHIFKNHLYLGPEKNILKKHYLRRILEQILFRFKNFDLEIVQIANRAIGK